MRTIVETVQKAESVEYARHTLGLLDVMENSPVYSQFPLFLRLAPYLRAQLHLILGEPTLAYEHYSLAMSRYQETDAALAMVAEMASAGYPEEALLLLKQADEVLTHQKSRKLKRSRTSYEQDISYLEDTLKEARTNQNTVMENP